MGWAGGSQILTDVWEIVREYIPEDERVDILKELMLIFESNDCDTLNEIIRSDWKESEKAYDEYLIDRDNFDELA